MLALSWPDGMMVDVFLGYFLGAVYLQATMLLIGLMVVLYVIEVAFAAPATCQASFKEFPDYPTYHIMGYVHVDGNGSVSDHTTHAALRELPTEPPWWSIGVYNCALLIPVPTACTAHRRPAAKPSTT